MIGRNNCFGFGFSFENRSILSVVFSVVLFLLDPSALLHLYLQCVHSTAPVAKVAIPFSQFLSPLATVRGLLITFAARRYFTVWLEERLVAGLLILRSRFLKRVSLLLHSCGIGVWDWRSVLMMNRPRSTNDSLSAEAFPAACSSIILPIVQTARQYPGCAWLAYYLAFRKDAAASGLTEWSKITWISTIFI